MSRHVNNGSCDKCEEIFDAYPNVHEGLKQWFKAFQKKVPDAHISCAGRGKEDQEKFFLTGKSRAHYGQSAHSFNLAIDLFRLTADSQLSYDKLWFRDKVGTAVFGHNASPDRTFILNWYGKPGSRFFELPHVEIEDWETLVAHGLFKLVEPK